MKAKQFGRGAGSTWPRMLGARGAWLGVVAVGVAVGCEAGDDAAAERAAQIEAGRAVYDTRCATCHEVNGGLGPRLGARALAGYETAERLFNYLRLTMPYGAGGSLSEEEYWSIVAYLAGSRELADWQGKLGEGVGIRFTATTDPRDAADGAR